MNPISYNFSFIHGKWPHNRVRFWVESRLRIIDEKNNLIEDYYQCAACKSEDTFAKSNLFYTDNYDFTPVFGPKKGIIFRRKAYVNDNYKSCPDVSEMWMGQEYALKELDKAVLLNTAEDICKYTHKNIPLVGQTEIWNEESGIRAILEYPIKTMNINDEHAWYQADTGPVLFPDFNKEYSSFVDCISLAYVAFNVPSFADFVVEQPTKVSKNTACQYEIMHYSNPISLPSKNTVFAGY
ncbi:MAG: hypothetical protein ABFD25_06125 [Clostridiaceae bacterium]